MTIKTEQTILATALLTTIFVTTVVFFITKGVYEEDCASEEWKPPCHVHGGCVELWSTESPCYKIGYDIGYEDARQEYKFAPEGKPSNTYNEIENKCVECWNEGYEIGYNDRPSDEEICGALIDYVWERPYPYGGTPSGINRGSYEAGYTKGYNVGWNIGFGECENICEELLEECGYESK